MEHAKERLSEYLDGALADADRKAVDEHLAACADCRAELESLRSVSRLVAGLPKQPLPAGVMERLKRRREAGGASRPLWLPFSLPHRWQAAAAFASAGVAVMFVAYREARLRVRSAELEASSRLETSAAPQAADKKYWRKDIHASGAPLLGGAGALESEQKTAASQKVDLVAPGIPAPTRTGGSNEALQSFLQKERTRMGIREILSQRGSGAAEAASEAQETAERPMNKNEAMAYVRQMTDQISRINQARQSRLAPVVPVAGASKPKLLARSESSHPLGIAHGSGKGPSLAPEDSFALVRGQALSQVQPAQAPAPPPLSLIPAEARAKKAAPSMMKLPEAAADFHWKRSWSGAAGGLSAGNSVIKEQSRWEAFWAKLGQGAQAPAVDFAKEMVVAVVGAENTGVEIGSMREQGPTLWVSYRGTAPKEGAAGRAPYHIVVVGRSDSVVNFEEGK
ncbi:MAG: zf-HC2 domain-containing protein [Elusimicrobia bacterium]|nr:zf-HC2 domain-containing protein [Elusimicrobiota bacterium]